MKNHVRVVAVLAAVVALLAMAQPATAAVLPARAKPAQRVAFGAPSWSVASPDGATLLSPFTLNDSVESTELPVAASRTYRDLDKTLWLDGRINNPGANAVTDVMVEIHYYNAVGTELGVGQNEPADCWAIDPGSFATFSVRSEAPAGWASYTASATGDVMAPGERRTLLDTFIDNYDGGWDYRVYGGTITNNTGSDVVRVIAAGVETATPEEGASYFLDSMFDYSNYDVHLVPGESSRFELMGAAGYAEGTEDSRLVWAEGLTVPPAPGLTVFVRDLRVPLGATASLDGRLFDAGLTPSSYTAVDYRTSADGASWGATRSVVTDVDGRFAVSTVPTSITHYRFFQPAGSDGDPITADVGPKAALSLSGAPADADRSQSFTLKGTLKPRHAAGSKPVVLRCYRQEATGWVLRKSASVKVSNYKSYSSYAAKLSLPSAGTWMVVATTPADAQHYGGESDPRFVNVNRATLSLHANKSTMSVSSGAKLTCTVRTAGKHAAIKGRTIRVEQRDYQTGALVSRTTLKTSKSGRVTYTAHDPFESEYRFTFAGDTTYLAGASRTKTIHPTGTRHKYEPGPFGTASANAYLNAGKHEIVFHTLNGVDETIMVRGLLGSHPMSHTWAVDKGPGFYRHSFTTKRRLPVPIYFSGAGPWVAYVW